MTAARFYSSVAGQMVLQADITSASTTISVDTTTGLPGTTPFTLIIDPGLSTEEILTVTNVSGLALTVSRGQDGSSAQTHTAGAKLRHMATARDFREPQEHMGLSAGVHGVTGSVVGTTDTQVVTNKDLSSATNTFPGSLATDAELAAHTGATAAHGATGAVVGTTNAQALTNKDLSSGTNTFPANNATTDGVQTLTNKTISGASNTLSNIPDAAVPNMNTRVGNIETNLGSQTTFVASSAAKDGKRIHWGVYTGTTNASGYLTVTHGAGFTPTAVVVTASIPGGYIDLEVDTITATTFRVQAWVGSTLNSTSITFYAFLGE